MQNGEFNNVFDWQIQDRLESGIHEINDAEGEIEIIAALVRQVKLLTEQNKRQQDVIDELRQLSNS